MHVRYATAYRIKYYKRWLFYPCTSVETFSRTWIAGIRINEFYISNGFQCIIINIKVRCKLYDWRTGNSGQGLLFCITFNHWSERFFRLKKKPILCNVHKSNLRRSSWRELNAFKHWHFIIHIEFWDTEAILHVKLSICNVPFLYCCTEFHNLRG